MARNIPDDWPNAAISRVVSGPVHRWHLQELGEGPILLLLHGAGGSTHSLRDLVPLLASDFRVLAMDLPGHGFTQLGSQRRSGLEQMSEDILKLLDQENTVPHGIIAHSAGAAIALQMTRSLSGTRVVGINAALGHFEGIAGVVFPAMAKMLAAVPFSAKLFSSASANPSRIKALIDSTGSTLSQDGMNLYQRLVADPNHVDGTLKMMAQWDLSALLDALPSLTASTLFLTGDGDTTVPSNVSFRAAETMPNATCLEISGYGHLIHEEAPSMIARHATSFLNT